MQRVQARLDPPEVVVGLPVACELLQRRELDALRPIFDELLAGPARRRDAPAQVVDLLLRNLDVEGAYLGRALVGGTHDDLPSRSGLKAARISSANSSGSSQAAKCPPLSTSLK